ncbi:MAG: ABC transporter permease subunit [Planctomycetes bacterium]|nr:ABC transporter permease subunit [Planctomycetota bacterium]
MIRALVAKELRIDTGSRRMAAVRTLAIGCMAVSLLLGMWRFAFRADDPSAFPEYGREMFTQLSWILLAGALLLAPALSFGAVSGERRKGTLGVLYLVGYTPARVVLAKFVARFLAVAMALLGALPIFVLVYAYGGVSLVEVVVVFATCLAAAAWGSATGILASVLIEERMAALIACLAWILLYSGGVFGGGSGGGSGSGALVFPGAAGGGGGGGGGGGAPGAWPAAVGAGANWTGPVAVLVNVLDLGLLREGDLSLAAPWAGSDLALLAQAAVFVLLACVVLPWLSQSGFRPSAFLGRLGRALESLVPSAVPSSRQLLEAEDADTGFNPYAWREVYGRTRVGLRSIGGLVLLTVVGLCVYQGTGAAGPYDAPEQRLLLLALAAGGLLVLTALSASSIATEKENKTLELLYLHGLVPFRYVYGKYLGLFWISLLVCVPAFVQSLFVGIGGRGSILVPLSVVFALPLGMAFTIAHGLSLSLKCDTETRAVVSGIVAQVAWLAFQYAAGLVCFPLFALNPVYLILAAALYDTRTRSDDVCVFFVLFLPLGYLIYRLNVWHIQQVLWKTAGQLKERLLAYLEGSGRQAV